MNNLYITELGQLLASLIEPVESIIGTAMPLEARQKILEAGFFRPIEDELIGAWFARFVSVRTELLNIIRRIDELAPIPLRDISTNLHWQCFIVGYSSACLLVKLDRFLLFQFATHKTIQRKLNEAFGEYRIPKKQYTAVFVNFTDPLTALRLNKVMKFADNNRDKLDALASDQIVGEFAVKLKEFELNLDASKRNYLRHTVAYVLHSFRRRGARAKQKSMFTLLEGVGRTASELKLDREKLVTPQVIDEAMSILQPGDVLVTRHRYALTNLFLPGVWPHAALYIGTPAQRSALGIELPEGVPDDETEYNCTFEALKDGVKLRAITETLAVDYFVVLRPALSQTAIKQGLERVLVHNGKRYNFDFDFFRSDRLVCTEVVFRAFDGLDDLHFPLQERGGRQTVSAEDFLDMAVDTGKFSVLGIFGYPEGESSMVSGERAREEMIKSYR